MPKARLLDRPVLAKTIAMLPVSNREFPLYRLAGVVAPAGPDVIFAEGGISFQHVDDAGTIAINVVKPAEQKLSVVNIATPSPRLARGTVERIQADPAFARGHIKLEESEASLADVVAAEATADKWDALRKLLGGELRWSILETIHDWIAKAFQGTATFTVGDATKTLSYGLTAIARPSVKWSTIASSTPLYDLDVAKDTFAETAGVEPNVAIAHPQVYRWIANAAATKTDVRAVSDLQRAAIEGRPIQFGNLEWNFVRGKFAGSDRWNRNTITLANVGDVGAGVYPNGIPTVAFRTAKLRENDYRGGFSVRRVTSEDPVEEKLVASLNGIAVVQKRTHVQTFEINW